ncbi:30S ribosomal protein S17 [Chloroflexota bacterium]
MTDKQKTRQGLVVGTKMDKTAIVLLEKVRRHPIYRKTIKRTERIKVHDADNACQLGDTVRIVETRPLSREKRWRIAEILTRHEVADIQPGEITE